MNAGPLRWSLLVVILTHLAELGVATHFRGASMWWNPIANELNKVSIFFRASWRREWRDSTYCDSATVASGRLIGPPSSGYIMCVVGCGQSTVVGNTLFRCTDFSVAEDWTSGIGNHNFSYQGNGFYIISWAGEGWLEGVHHGDDVPWEVRMTVKLNIRPDTGRLNSSPRSAVSPIMRLQHGCAYTYRIPVSDPDGDRIRCRWARKESHECGGICQTFEGAMLNEETCVLTYTANRDIGYYAVAIQLEDYPRNAPQSTEALSSVPVQFLVLVNVTSSTSSCDARPEFVAPTPGSLSCQALSSGNEYSILIVVRTKDDFTSLQEVQTVSSVGMLKSEIDRYGNNPRDHFVNITWIPDASQAGEKIFCFVAEDTNGISSGQRCIYLMIDLPRPKPQSLTYNVQTRVVTIYFDREVQRPTQQRFMRLYSERAGDGLALYDSSNTGAVTITGNRISFSLTQNLADSNARYYLVVDAGVVTGTERCGADSEPVSDQSALTWTVGDPTEPTTTGSPSKTTDSGAVVQAGRSWDYTWLIVIVVGVVLLAALGAFIAVLIRKRHSGSESAAASRQDASNVSSVSKLAFNQGYHGQPDFNDFEVKYR